MHVTVAVMPSVLVWRQEDNLTCMKFTPGRCPEIPEVLKVVLKFTPCPELFLWLP